MVWAVLCAGLGALGLCLLAAPLGRILRIIDVPDGERKRHLQPTPMVGGIAVAVPVLAVLAVLAVETPFMLLHAMVGIALVVFFGLGLIDDRSHLRPLFRLSFSVVLVLAVLFAVPSQQVTFFHFSFFDVAVFLGGGWSILFTVLCLVGLQNAVNLADGRNGLALGLLLIWTLLLLSTAPPHVQPMLGALAAALAVTAIFNLRGTLFLGDSGTYGLSITVGLLTIHVYGLEFPGLHADAVALWFLVPILDAVRLILFRMMDGRSPFTPDADHLHHILGRWMPWHLGLPLYLVMVAAPALLALASPDSTLPLALGVLTVYCGVVLASRGGPSMRRLLLRFPRA